MRKVLPLRDKLAELDCWITGLRRQQSDTRAGIGIIELYAFDDTGRDIVKLNPMANWSREASGNICTTTKFLTIRCTIRAIARSVAGPAPRTAQAAKTNAAGRWTGFNKVECGIHTFMPKKS